MRAVLELAQFISRTTELVLVAEKIGSPSFFGITNVIEAGYAPKLGHLLLHVSRGDHVTPGCFNVIVQHGPHHILGLKEINLKHVDAVICVSKFSAMQQLRYGIPRRKLQVVPNGIDKSVFWFKDEIRTSKSFIYAGHIRGYKGIVTMLRAFFEVLQIYPEATLEIYGENMVWSKADSGFDWLLDNDYLDVNLRIIWSRIIKDCPGIIFGGEVSQNTLSTQFNRNSFVVCASVIPETFGLVSLEAQACGCIPIYARHGGYPETIMRSAPKLTFEPGNHRDLALTMLNALKTKPDLVRNKQVASEASRYTWDRTNTAITSIIDRVIKRKAFLMRLKSFFTK